MAVLFGRDREEARLDRLIESARAGNASPLVVRGEAGIGKTALLTGIAARVARADPPPTILRVEGHEVESHVAFGGLSRLLDPLTHLLPTLLDVQRAALAGALRLDDEPTADRLAIGAAALNLVSAATETGPVLILVDDAHWLDLPSLEAIVFACRRMRAERVAAVFAARPATDVDPAIDRWLTSLPELALTGLTEGAVADLLAERGLHLEPGQLRRHVAETAGNPLALMHLASVCKELSPVEPVPIGRRLELAFGRRLDTCSQSTRMAMLLLAVSGSEIGLLDRLLEQKGLSFSDLEPAEVAGLVRAESGVVRFAHPLIRSAVYQTATPAERRQAHRAVASIAAELGAASSGERTAFHLAAACALPDARVAQRVESSALAAVARRSYSSAMGLYETAARLSPSGTERLRRLLAAADLSLTAGRAEAGLDILLRLSHETDSAELLSRAVHLRCRIEMWGGRPVDARDLLLAESAGVAAEEPVWKAVMLSHAALLTVMLGDQSGAVATATTAVDLVSALPVAMIMPALVVQALTFATDGQVVEAAALLERCEEHVLGHDPLASDQVLLIAALAEDSLERSDAAMRWYRRATGAARAAGASGVLPFQLNGMAMAHWRRGDWASALSTAAEAADLAEQAGWLTEVPNCLVNLALIEAGLGRTEDCAAHAARAVDMARPQGARIVEARADLALALIDLGTASFGSAARRLKRVSDFATEGGLNDPVLLNWAADGAEAGLRAGDQQLAEAATRAVRVEAERSNRPTALARAARIRALTTDNPGDVADAIDEALAHHGEAKWPFEEARTRLVHGELLRRARRPARARDALVQAVDMFERLGAVTFARRARDELRAAGGDCQGLEVNTVALTPQEVHVALVVAEGATNIEAAAQLFLSPKTVEFHLSNVYRKLGLRSRGQLARAVADGQILARTRIIPRNRSTPRRRRVRA